MRFHIAAESVVLSLALVCLQANAQSAPSTDPLLSQATQLLQEKKPADAYALLSAQEAQRAGDPAFDYLLGIAAIDAGQATRAIFALERVLAVEPNNNLARAEIARAYVAAGERETAIGEFRQARMSPMPKEAADNIDRVLNALTSQSDFSDSDSRRIFRGYAEVLAGWDSNVNSATSANQFAVPAFGGAVFTLTPSSQSRSDLFAGIAGGINAKVPVDAAWSFNAGLNAKKLINQSEDDMNTTLVDASVGATYTTGPNAITAALQSNTYLLGGSRFREANGGSLQWQRSLDMTSQFTVFGQASKLHYPGQGIRDANRYVAGAGYAKILNGPLDLAFGSIYLTKENPDASGVPQLGHHGAGVRLGTESTMGAIRLFASAQFEKRNYGGPEPFFGYDRSDKQFDAAFGFHYMVMPGWRLTPQINFTRNNSNIVLFDYKRAAVQVALRTEF